jgi:hypothetical protein
MWIRIQVTNWMRIHVDPDPKHCLQLYPFKKKCPLWCYTPVPVLRELIRQNLVTLSLKCFDDSYTRTCTLGLSGVIAQCALQGSYYTLIWKLCVVLHTYTGTGLNARRLVSEKKI